MDNNSTPTELLPAQPVGSGYAAQPEQKRFPGAYRFLVVAVLLVGAVVLGTLTARWIGAMQVETVFPDAPIVTASSQCGVEPTVAIPEVEGVSYSQERTGDLLTVEAVPESKHYELSKGAKTSWDISLAPEACPDPAPGTTDGQPEAPATGTEDYVGDVIDGAKDVGSEVWDWTKEYGPGIWDRMKELGNGAKESVEDWSQGSSE